jgi:hypothetical protein
MKLDLAVLAPAPKLWTYRTTGVVGLVIDESDDGFLVRPENGRGDPPSWWSREDFFDKFRVAI